MVSKQYISEENLDKMGSGFTFLPVEVRVYIFHEKMTFIKNEQSSSLFLPRKIKPSSSKKQHVSY